MFFSGYGRAFRFLLCLALFMSGRFGIWTVRICASYLPSSLFTEQMEEETEGI